MGKLFTTEKFTQNFLQLFSKPAGSLPRGAQWIVAFEDLQGDVLPAIKEAAARERRPWVVANAAQEIAGPTYQDNAGCILCQAISLPGDGTTVVAEGNIKSNAFIRSYVGAGREDFPIMRMSFLDTNVSFADNFLRSWALATANFGLFARPKGNPKNYRTNLYCWKLGQFSPEKPPMITMQMTFFDICCVSVSEEENNYAPVAGSPALREARFIYNYYEVNSEKEGNEFLSSIRKEADRKALVTATVQNQTATVRYVQDEMVREAANITSPNPTKFGLGPSSEAVTEQMAQQQVNLNNPAPVSLF